jgi:regulator of RNase E activity RraA
LVAGTPLGRFGEPEDIAPVAVFLASDDSHWVTGESIRAAGGVRVAGVCVTPGDYVFADAAGAVVIPAASLDRVLEEARAVAAEDSEAAARIREERPPR